MREGATVIGGGYSLSVIVRAALTDLSKALDAYVDGTCHERSMASHRLPLRAL